MSEKKDYEKKSCYESTTVIGITRDTHNLIKAYCKKNDYKIGLWSDNVLREKLDELNK